MNRLMDFFKNLGIKIPVLPRMARPSTRQIIFWGAAIALAIGLFIFTRGFVTCWELTTLDGIPPASCNADTNVAQTPGFNPKGTPLAAVTPTEGAVPDIV